MRRLLSALVFAAALTGMPATVRAAAVVYTFTGTVTDGFDASGVFLGAGQSFTGQAFTASFTRDDATPGAVQSYAPDSSQITGLGAASPVVSALTINGRTRSFGTRRGRQVQSSAPCGTGCTDDAFTLYTDDAFEGFLPSSSMLRSMFFMLELGGVGANFLDSADYHSLTSLDLADGVDLGGSFSIFDQVSTFFITTRVISQEEAYGFFEVQSLTVTGLAPTAVPEPSTWALMILGFGAAGTMLRRRRTAAA
jgi:hypothetical protein